MQDGNPPEVLTALDKKAEVVCAYIEAAGNIVEVLNTLAAKGIKIGRQRVNTIIRNDPQILEWTQKHFDKAYSELCRNRLEAVTAVGIQHCNEEALALVSKIRLLWFRELQRKTPNEKLLALYADFIRSTDTSLIKQNLIISRFKDGLHSRQPLVDQSQHKTDVLNFGEGVLPLETITAIDKKFGLSQNRLVELAALPKSSNGDNS